MNFESKYTLWLEKASEDPDLIHELTAIKGNEEQISDRFYTELKFGTGGLRGIIGAGDNRMNIYTVGKATQGLANYLLTVSDSPRAAVSFDSRIKSDTFAKRAAGILAANGIHVYMVRELEPTPVLSYMVRYYNCDAGIMITASHNPSKYNGYKCYGPDGCQITDNAAENITSFIEKTDIFNDVKYIDFDAAIADGKITFVDEKFFESYFSKILGEQINPGICEKVGINILYTPLNGTGNKPVREILKRIGATVSVVPEQENPDGNFPTAPYPNPEIPQAFECAKKIALQNCPDLILATDPDCDRVGIAVKKGSDYVLMSGNEVGCMLLNYILSEKKKKGTLPKNAVAVKTIVTSNLSRKIAQKYSCNIVEVLTGFKYIGEQIGLLEKENREDDYILGFEESYGYLTGTFVRDKDAVNASMLIVEMAAFYKEQGKSLLDVMSEIYTEFGIYRHKLINKEFSGEKGMSDMQKLMDRLRNNSPAAIAGIKVIETADYLLKVKTNLITGEKTALTLPTSNVLSFGLENEGNVIIRPSGTEPKVKAYLTACGKTTEFADNIISALEKEVDILFTV